MAFPQVFNLKLAKPSSPKFDVIIDRTSHWGNPFKLSNYDRETSLKLYRAKLWNDIQDNKISIAELASLQNKNLWCWCHPLPCHGDILLEAAKWAYKELYNG